MWLRRAGYMLLFVAVLLIQQLLPTRPSQTAAPCHAELAMGERAGGLATASTRWDCSGTDWRAEGNRIALRFDLAEGASLPWLVTRASDFDRLAVTVRDASGHQVDREYRPADLVIGDGVARMYARLPALADARLVFVEIDNPHFAGMAKGAGLEAEGPDGHSSTIVIFVAILCGLLLAPIVFDLAYYRVLRERFFLWHAATGALMLTYSAVTGGVLAKFVPVSGALFGPLATWSFALGIACAAMFFLTFVETDHIREREKRGMQMVALGCVGIALLEQASPFPGDVMQRLFYALWIPVIATFAWMLITTLRRGSRAANFLVLAWMPLATTGVYRIFGNIGLNPQPVDAFEAFYLAIMLEVLISALGVADRFLALRRDRDQAWTEARVQGAIAEVDVLTGLANRRAIDGRFPALFADGFRTMAVLDIDKFKLINDRNGHVVGDSVLKAVASALSPDHDTMVLRLGGEEFMLLLRGEDAVQRAESRRQAIALRVAALVPGLEAPVTASMGLVTIAPEGLGAADFGSLYSHCDRLLYEAKANGRNRTMRASMRGFGAPRRAQALAG
ncbi:GGDEF domain-containing protein [Novosphingobium sp. MW5]|nr:GGDEF domain-containing protein [Novosphingobium sp. MW5]